MMKKSLAKVAVIAIVLFGLVACGEQAKSTQAEKTIFLAGASGVIGMPLSKALVEKGYVVYGTTRSPEKAKALEEMGVKPVVVDVFNADALQNAVVQSKPDVVINELSALPKGLKEDEMVEGLKRDSKIRIEGTRNLVMATEKAGAKKYITQSFMYYAPSDKAVDENGEWISEQDAMYGESVRAVKSLEQQALAGKFVPVVLRYGWIYGGTSGFEQAPEGYAGIHVNTLVDATVKAVETDLNGVYNVAEDSPVVDTSKFKQAVPTWQGK